MVLTLTGYDGSKYEVVEMYLIRGPKKPVNFLTYKIHYVISSLIHGRGDFWCRTLPSDATANRLNFLKTSRLPILSNVNGKELLDRLNETVRERKRIRNADFDSVIREISKDPNFSVSRKQAFLLIRCCGSLFAEESPEVRMQYLQFIWKYLEELNQPFDIWHYNTLLQVYCENDYEFMPDDILTELEVKNLLPNLVTYNWLIWRYCRLGDNEGAFSLLVAMDRRGMFANQDTYNSLIMGYANRGKFEQANNTIQQMKKVNIPRNNQTFTHLMCGHAKTGHFSGIQKIMAECKLDGIKLNDANICEIIYELVISGHEDYIDSLLINLSQLEDQMSDRINIILRLMRAGHIDVSLKILQTFPKRELGNGLYAKVGNFFMRAMAQNKFPFDKLIQTCDELKRGGNHKDPHLELLRWLLTNANVDYALKLMTYLKTNGTTIEQLYFWPLFCCRTTNQEIIELVQVMKRDFGVEPTIETLKDYVIPNLKNWNVDEITTSLSGDGLCETTAVTSMSILQIQANNLKVAADLMSKHNVYYSPTIFKHSLTRAFNATGDTKNYVRIVRNIYDNFRCNNDSRDTNADATGDLIFDALQRCDHSNRISRCTLLLEELIRHGIAISSKRANGIQNLLGTDLTDNLLTLLGKVVKFCRTENRMSNSKITKLLDRADTLGQDTDDFNKVRLLSYKQSNDLKNYEQLINAIENNGKKSELRANMYVSLIQLQAQSGQPQQTLETFTRAKRVLPNFQLKNFTAISIVSSLMERDAINVALEFLELNRKTNRPSFKTCLPAYEIACWKLLNAQAMLGNVKETNALFDCMQYNNYIEVTNTIAGPLVAANLVNNDLEGAVKCFQRIAMRWNITPLFRELMRTLIIAKDSKNLNKIIAIGTEVRNTLNINLELALAYVECEDVDGARKTFAILNANEQLNEAETQKILSMEIMQYYQRGAYKSLEMLLQATAECDTINRNDMYHCLALIYCKSGLADTALKLWNQIKVDQIEPRADTIELLENYFKTKKSKASNDSASPGAEKAAKRNKKQLDSLLLKAINENRINDAKALIIESIHHNSVDLKTIRMCLTKITDAGDIETLMDIFSCIPESLRITLEINVLTWMAHVASNRIRQYFAKLFKDFDEAKEENHLQAFISSIPHASIFRTFEKRPECIAEYEAVAQKAAEQQFPETLTAVWCFYFVHNNHEAEQRLWTSHVQHQTSIKFEYITQTCIRYQNVALVQKLINLLEMTTSVSEDSLGVAHTALLDIYITKGDVDAAISFVDELCKKNIVKYINRQTLVRIKKAAQAVGKRFPFKI